MRKGWAFVVLFSLSLSSCTFQTLKSLQNRSKMVMSSYEQINFVELMRRYVSKEKAGRYDIEGIYSVSISVLKKNKPLFSSEFKEKEVERKENYAQVAIIRDNSRNNREYIEIPLDKANEPSYSVRGEFTGMSSGNVLVLKHFEPKGRILNYQFAYDEGKEILEGISTETSGNVTYTYKLTFVKLYPKGVRAPVN
jgi:hypothetical protein